MHARPERGVGVHPLAGGRAGEQLQKDLEILPTGDDLFNAHNRNQHLGQGQTHAPIAFRLDHGDGAGFGNGKVRPTGRHFDLEKLFAQIAARNRSQISRLVGKLGYPQRAHEEFADLRAVLVNRWHQDV